MKNVIYPAIFHKDSEGKYMVTFPDLVGCSTYGYALEEALNMVGDALYACLDALENVPAPSDIHSIKAEGGDFVLQIKAEPYMRKEGGSEV